LSYTHHANYQSSTSARKPGSREAGKQELFSQAL
jgi:hypothetical protein